MRVRGGKITDRDAQAIMEIMDRYKVVTLSLVDVALRAAALSDDDVVRELLRAGVENAAAQLSALVDMGEAAVAESQRRAQGGA